MLKDNLKYYREYKYLSISELSRKSGVAKSYISQIESGKKEKPSMAVLAKLAQELNVTVEDLTTREPGRSYHPKYNASDMETLNANWAKIPVVEAAPANIDILDKSNIKEFDYINRRNLTESGTFFYYISKEKEADTEIPSGATALMEITRNIEEGGQLYLILEPGNREGHLRKVTASNGSYVVYNCSSTCPAGEAAAVYKEADIKIIAIMRGYNYIKKSATN